MSKKTTIFRQLVISILIPVILVIALISLINYFEKKNQIVQSRQQTIRLIQAEVGEFLTFFDFTLFELEKEMALKGEYFSEILVGNVFKETRNIETVNMDSIHNAIGMDVSQDIYIIDTNGVIVNTTYEKDLGLDFYKLSDYFIDHFNSVRKRKVFIADRISIEMTTNLPKKYMYRTTDDSKYIIELGFYNEPAKNLVDQFILKLNTMPEKYEGIDTVSLFFGTNSFSSYQKHRVPPRDSLIAIETLTTGVETRSDIFYNGLKYTSEYSRINMESSLLHKGYVIRIVHNNKMELQLVQKELIWFFLNLLIFALPIFLLILWRARVLSRPISQLVNKMTVIQKGNLNERVSVKGNNEVSELGEQFNSMIAQLQDSYDTLEQKVDDRTRELKEQKEIVEEAHKEITDSIKYAKRIQAAILPPIRLVNELFKENFILYLPKDIVAGDFYWMQKVGDSILFAAADCTGHGVPGALVSVVCNNALNRSVREYGLCKPGKILDKTREIVIQEFEKSDEEVKDGMDISLCALTGSTLEWSGANNPLWILRKQNESYEIIEFKADKQPIGKFAAAKTFTTHLIQLQKGDTIYIFTDGYQDQFGGDKGKKFKAASLRDLIIKNADQSLETQCENFKQSFHNWKADLEQIDDVCLIAIRPSVT